MRIFTAIPLPEEVKSKLIEVTRGKLPVPYVSTENLHITLDFFGELDSDQVTNLKSLFVEATKDNAKINIQFEKIVKFINHQLHLTIRLTNELLNLQMHIRTAFINYGFTFDERYYYPHVKLANMHLDNVMNRQRKLENFPNEELRQLDFIAQKIVLYESKLLLHHPNYTPLMEQALI